jgi:tetratricopeptide (TPR) repeat protein
MPRLKSTHIDHPAECGRRLKEAREAAGISQRRLAFPGCTAAYISRIEAGERIPSLQLLRELGRRLGVSADWLATGSDAALPESQRLLEAEVALRLDDLERARGLYEEALAQAALDADKAGAIAGLGQIAFRAGDPQGAVALLEDALDLLGDEATSHPALADTLGRAYARVGEPESAVAVFQRFLDAARTRGDKVETMRFSVLLANAYIDSGNFASAEELVGQGLALAEEWNDPIVRARLYWSQSRLHAEQGDAAIAARYARRALEIVEMTEHTHYTARAHQLLAHIELDRGRPEAALEALEHGRPLIAETGNPLERAEYSLEEARALAALGRKEEAGALAMQISGLIAEANPQDAGRAYALLAEVHESLGDTARARELYELAAELLERTPSRYLVEVLSRLAALLEAEGRQDEALAVLKRAVGIRAVIPASSQP